MFMKNDFSVQIPGYDINIPRYLQPTAVILSNRDKSKIYIFIIGTVSTFIKIYSNS